MLLKVPVLLLITTAGCLYRGAGTSVDIHALDVADGWDVLREVPVVRQTDAQDCGVAVTVALLRYWQRTATLESLRDSLREVPGESVPAGRIRTYLRQRDFDAFLIEGRQEDLARQVAKGRPVLVGLVQPYASSKWLSHYALVVGHHSEHGVITMDPAYGHRRYDFAGFDREWAAARRLMLIAVPRTNARSRASSR